MRSWCFLSHWESMSPSAYSGHTGLRERRANAGQGGVSAGSLEVLRQLCAAEVVGEESVRRCGQESRNQQDREDWHLSRTLSAAVHTELVAPLGMSPVPRQATRINVLEVAEKRRALFGVHNRYVGLQENGFIFENWIKPGLVRLSLKLCPE